MKGELPCTAAEEIDTFGLQFASTGSSQHKPQPVFLDHEVHFIQQLRQTLNFVDDYDAALWLLRRHLLSDEGRIVGKPEEHLLIQQIVICHLIAKRMSDKLRLASLARAEK